MTLTILSDQVDRVCGHFPVVNFHTAFCQIDQTFQIMSDDQMVRSCIGQNRWRKSAPFLLAYHLLTKLIIMQHQLAMQLNCNAIIQWLNSYNVRGHKQLWYKIVLPYFNQSLHLFIAHTCLFQFLLSWGANSMLFPNAFCLFGFLLPIIHCLLVHFLLLV